MCLLFTMLLHFEKAFLHSLFDMMCRHVMTGRLFASQTFEILREINMTQSIQAYQIRKHSNSLHNAQIGNSIAYNNVNSKVLSFNVHNRSFHLLCILHCTLVGIVELPQIVQISQIYGKILTNFHTRT